MNGQITAGRCDRRHMKWQSDAGGCADLFDERTWGWRWPPAGQHPDKSGRTEDQLHPVPGARAAAGGAKNVHRAAQAFQNHRASVVVGNSFRAAFSPGRRKAGMARAVPGPRGARNARRPGAGGMVRHYGPWARRRTTQTWYGRRQLRGETILPRTHPGRGKRGLIMST